MADSRHIITPDAFAVAPALLGLPLASATRRGVAMAVDGLLIAILANAPSVLFGLAAAVVLFRASARSNPGGYIGRSMRLMFRFGAAIVLFSVVVSGWESVRDRFRDRDADRGRSRSASPSSASFTGMAGVQALGHVAALRSAENDTVAIRAAQRLAEQLVAQGLPPDDVREVVRASAQGTDKPWIAAAADSVARGFVAPPRNAPIDADTVVTAALQGLSQRDSVAYDSLRPLLVSAIAADTLATLQRQIGATQARVRELEEELEDAREGRGVMAFLRTMAQDLGLGFGWSGLYFTAFLALWRGQTPGKRLVGVRVIRLDGKPMTWWAAFERFGGYAASLATGLLGFFQILWDANRQGIHDKIAYTVVIRS
jgi:hypothetical protein